MQRLLKMLNKVSIRPLSDTHSLTKFGITKSQLEYCLANGKAVGAFKGRHLTGVLLTITLNSGYADFDKDIMDSYRELIYIHSLSGENLELLMDNLLSTTKDTVEGYFTIYFNHADVLKGYGFETLKTSTGKEYLLRCN